MDRNYPLIKPFDERRSIAFFDSAAHAYLFARDLFFQYGQEALEQRGTYHVALPGGTTPKKLFPLFEEKKALLDWKKVFIYFTDERMVGLEDPDCNYRLAQESFFASVLPKENIFPMVLSRDPLAEATRYEAIIKSPLDFVLLGMGDDAHIASLFPKTYALQVKDRLVVENYIPEKELWRVSLTYKTLEEARHLALLVLGETKAKAVHDVFLGNYDPTTLPAQKIGTHSHPALWIVDAAAADKFCSSL